MSASLTQPPMSAITAWMMASSKAMLGMWPTRQIASRTFAHAIAARVSLLPESSRMTSAGRGMNCPLSGLRNAAKKPLRTSSSE